METLKTNNVKDTNLDIYILMGQSNMAGRGPLTPDDNIIKNEKVLMLTEDLKWVPAKNPIHFDKPGTSAVGPGLSFGLAMQSANKNIEIGLVPTAVGGTSINSWQPKGYDSETKKYPYDDAEKRIIEAMKTGTIKGILWHQGESDSKPEAVAGYLAKLKVLINRVRTLVGNPNLPFIAGELGRYNTSFQTFNTEINKLPSEVPNTAVVSSEGLTDKGDNLHFTSASAITLGQRYAEKMLLLQKK
ncbi:sialate O-acetylesterase [Pedobacter changchengzhani]|uniref:Sialate O-acetylesterase n=2 Tax=Pedobacter changchengzhani TaxID=2529274 RepID=A0A4R5MQ52_9SPHI|nr:sialate O-acetylesterase [Pedobacter changchengzhani]